MFDELFAGSLSDRVIHPDGAFRTMIQISLEAGESVDAERYFAQITALNPGAADNIRFVGLFALSKARLGDWMGVWRMFEKTREQGEAAGENRSRVFIPILKEHIRTHTIVETEAFLKAYIDKLHVRPSSAMVTLLANEYGNQRDVASFVSWLAYCADAGFKVDAAFSNAILRNCARSWKFCFRDLRTLYQGLRALSPNFENGVTGNIMKHAALSGSRLGGDAALARAVSLDIKQDARPTRGKFLLEQDVFLEMKRAYREKEYADATGIYQRAREDGTALSPRCLSLAVNACLQQPDADRDVAVRLLLSEQAKGHDISSAAAYLLISDLDAVHATLGSDAATTAINTACQGLEGRQLKISDTLLNKVALRLYEAKQFGSAISYALKAADIRGHRPGYNRWNFSVLLWAYSAQPNAAGIRRLVKNIAQTAHKSDGNCYKALKLARQVLRRSSSSWQVDKALKAVEEGLAKMKAEREKLGQEREEVAASVVEIMRRAAATSGSNPVSTRRMEALESRTRAPSIAEAVGVGRLPLVAEVGAA